MSRINKQCQSDSNTDNTNKSTELLLVPLKILCQSNSTTTYRHLYDKLLRILCQSNSTNVDRVYCDGYLKNSETDLQSNSNTDNTN